PLSVVAGAGRLHHFARGEPARRVARRGPKPKRAPMPSTLAVLSRLSVMMFLQFFIWGSWYVTVGNFMKSEAVGWTDDDVGWAYQVGPIAAIVSPLLLGMVVDRFFASERVLGVMHLLGGAIMWFLPGVAAGGGDDANLRFGWLLLAYMLCYMPTLSLSNAVAFHNLADRERGFPMVRVFGTLGWIVANWLVSKQLGADREPVQFQV